MFDDLAHHRRQGDVGQIFTFHPSCNSRRGAPFARRGKGNQFFLVAPIFPAWIPFPRSAARPRCSPGMTG